MIKKNNPTPPNKTKFIQTIIIGLNAFLIFPYILCAFIMNFLNSANSILNDINFVFSLILGVSTLVVSILCLKLTKHTSNYKLFKILFIINTVLSCLLSLIGLINFTYCFAILFPYVTILVEYLLIVYVPIAIIILLIFISVLIIELCSKKSDSRLNNL
jgi:hypothetical protein